MLLEILCRHHLAHDFYSRMLPTSCLALRSIFLIFAELLDYSFLLQLGFLIRVDLTISNYSLIELLFSNLAYLKILTFYKYNGKTNKRYLGMIKGEIWKNIAYVVYHGQKFSVSLIGAKKFESFESLVECTKNLQPPASFGI